MDARGVKTSFWVSNPNTARSYQHASLISIQSKSSPTRVRRIGAKIRLTGLFQKPNFRVSLPQGSESPSISPMPIATRNRMEKLQKMRQHIRLELPCLGVDRTLVVKCKFGSFSDWAEENRCGSPRAMLRVGYENKHSDTVSKRRLPRGKHSLRRRDCASGFNLGSAISAQLHSVVKRCRSIAKNFR